MLYEVITKVSSWLRNEMGHGQKILLLSSNSLFFIVAYLAIMKSGNTVVPLNPVIEKENFNYISEQVEATCGFIANNVLRRLEHNLEKVVNEMDLKEILLEPNNAYKSEADFDSEQLAQIIYTSGVITSYSIHYTKLYDISKSNVSGYFKACY